jgi:integrase/recombinase XerC
MAIWEVDSAKVLDEAEVQQTLKELRRKAKRSKTTYRTLLIFELATCYGLRVSEICSLTLGDVHTGLDPFVRIRRAVSKSGRARTVPLGWDGRSLADVIGWVSLRIAEGAGAGDLLLPTRSGKRMHRSSARRMYARVVRESVGRRATIHDGRHTFISWALHRGVDPQAVRIAAGHANLATTSLYSHVIRDKLAVTDLFSRPLNTVEA